MQNGMLDADGPLWSLYVEFHLYVVALFVALVMTASGTLKRTAAAALSIALVGWLIYKNDQFLFYLAVWSVGSGLSIWRTQIEQFKVALAGLGWAGL